MKRQKYVIEYLMINIVKRLIFFVAVLMVGCTPSETQSTQITSEAIVKSPTIATPLTSILTIIPTSSHSQISESTKAMTSVVTRQTTPFATTIIPSTATPQMTPSPTAVITPTATPQISFPTLTIAERQVAHQNFMLANGGCDLPCWWGIELGVSLENVNQNFTNLGLPWLKTEHSFKVESDQMGVFLSGYIDEDGTRPTYRLSTYTEVHEYNDAIGYIFTRMNRPNSEKAQQEFIRDWEQYYLSLFLQRYGKPIQVYFHIRSVGDLMIPPHYTIILLYSEQGIAITYHIEGRWLDEEHNQAEVCLNIENLREVQLSLFIPEQYERWKPQILPLYPIVKPDAYETWTWEDNFGVPLDTFYETYQHSDNLGCLYING